MRFALLVLALPALLAAAPAQAVEPFKIYDRFTDKPISPLRWQEGERIPRVMAITIHPYLTGVPHRIRYLEALYDHILGHEGVIVCTGAEILDFYRASVRGRPDPRS